ncbi:BQ5605_C003g02310 [Microbotryum silenes-dioicae]|uniref:BQ5605_C003g02310 protein n=1 Tax=Microbotryum silenes-dioicae TaxID=796604 RepID=A0A2X0P3X5_9BASI|nr:BQ5605_C003g02310 [Microbotryum silenes-dioicae]
MAPRPSTSHSGRRNLDHGVGSYDHSEDDDMHSGSDDGMFSFARPSTADQPTRSIPFGVPSHPSSPPTPDTVTLAPDGSARSTPPKQLNFSREHDEGLAASDRTHGHQGQPGPSTGSVPPNAGHRLPRNDIILDNATFCVDLGGRLRVGYQNSDSEDSSSGHHGFGSSTSTGRRCDTEASFQSESHDGSQVGLNPFGKSVNPSRWGKSDRQNFRLENIDVHPNQPHASSLYGDGSDDHAKVVQVSTDAASDSGDIEEDSPYAEVRASVSNWDDPIIPSLTFRSWFLGLTLCILLGSANTFLAFRYPSPAITPLVTLIVAYPLGKLLAMLLPIKEWSIPRCLRLGTTISLNPGPFSQKEHAVIVMMANVGLTPPYALNYSVASEVFYKIKYSFLFDFLLVLSSCTLGFGIAGLYRRFLVWPASLLWPQNLLLAALIATFHAEEDKEPDSVGIPRLRVFTYVIVGAAIWYWIPGYIFQGLSAFSFLFGVDTGLGMSLLTFDWAQIAFITSPLVIPWWAIANIFGCFVVTTWIVAPALYYSGVWSTNYLPISASAVFDRYGQMYNLSRIFNQHEATIDAAAYTEYSPLFLTSTYVCAVGLALALLPAALTHTGIYHGRDIWAKLRGRQTEREDIHNKLMKSYPDVPDWAYASFAAAALGLAMLATGVSVSQYSSGVERYSRVVLTCIYGSNQLWPTRTPVWAVLIAFLLGCLVLLPAGFVYAMSATPLTLLPSTRTKLQVNVPSELLAGYMMKGNPSANMLFKIYTLTTTQVGLSFVQDLKFGHYMKVQVVAVFVTCLAQIGVKRWLVANVEDFCQRGQSALLVCPTTRTFYSASIIWGAIGPSRLFGPGKQYSPLLFCALAGAVAPLLPWMCEKRWPRSWLACVSLPVAMNGALAVTSANGINYSSCFIVGFVFQYFLRRRHFSTWSKYVYIISAGLDSGTTFSALIIFFSLMLPKNGQLTLDWWGNNIFKKTADWAGTSHREPPPQGFGPDTW